MFRKGQPGNSGLCPRHWRKRLLPPLGIMLSVFALQLLAGLDPPFVERYYSRGLFNVVPRLLSFSGFLRFSLAEALLALFVVVFVVWLALLAKRIYLLRREACAILLDALSKLLWVAALCFIFFMLAFGLNYRRQPLAETFQLEQRDPNPAEIVSISRSVVEGINRGYEESGAASGGERGSRMPLSVEELYKVLESAYEAEPLLGGAPRVSVPPKPVYFSGFMSRLGISGFYSPFTGEANYNTLPPDCDLPFSIAHEMAHQRGFAREDEANFIAFLICTKSSNAYVRYSGYLGALRVLGVLYRVAPEHYREVVAALGEGARADLKARAQFWARYSGRLSNLGQGINHVYLKVNGVRSGVRNYNEASALIIGYYLKQAAASQTQAVPLKGLETRRCSTPRIECGRGIHYLPTEAYTIFYTCPCTKNHRGPTRPHAYSNATA